MLGISILEWLKVDSDPSYRFAASANVGYSPKCRGPFAARRISDVER